jgi:DNA-3-methyladenine glycosylase II
MASTKRITFRCIESEDDVREGVRALRRKCKIMRRVHDAAGQPPLRRDVSGFEGLARIIVGQQVSVASAAAIWGRFQTVVQPIGAGQVLLLTDENFRTAGLSRPKIRTLRAVAEAVSSGALDLDDFSLKADEQIRDALMAVSGIGPWTADVFLLFCLGRADAFAAGDLALQIAAQHAFELGERPDAVELVELAERWRPWRGVAARLLWAYYRTVKSAKSGAPV